MPKPTTSKTAKSAEPSPTHIYNSLIVKGMKPDEAASQVASLWGLQTTENGSPIHWRIEEIMNILFLTHRMQKEASE